MHCPSASSLSICLSQNCKIIVFYSNVSINFFHFANAFFWFNTLFLINVHFKLTTLPCCSRKHSNVFLARQSAPIQYFFKSKSQHKFQWNYKLFYSKVSITNFFRFANAFFSFNTLFLINVHFKLTTLPCCSRKHSTQCLSCTAVHAYQIQSTSGSKMWQQPSVASPTWCSPCYTPSIVFLVTGTDNHKEHAKTGG